MGISLNRLHGKRQLGPKSQWTLANSILLFVAFFFIRFVCSFVRSFAEFALSFVWVWVVFLVEGTNVYSQTRFDFFALAFGLRYSRIIPIPLRAHSLFIRITLFICSSVCPCVSFVSFPSFRWHFVRHIYRQKALVFSYSVLQLLIFYRLWVLVCV